MFVLVEFALHIFLLPIPLPLILTLFPYTTLFRSFCAGPIVLAFARVLPNAVRLGSRVDSRYETHRVGERSEEHTSELQSPDHLVCRLLLEKKNKASTPMLS